MGGVQNLNVRDAAAFHGDLHGDRTAIALRRAGIDAVGIGQKLRRRFRRLRPGLLRLLHRGGQLRRYLRQHRAGVGQRCHNQRHHRSRRHELHQWAQFFQVILLHDTPS